MALNPMTLSHILADNPDNCDQQSSPTSHQDVHSASLDSGVGDACEITRGHDIGGPGLTGSSGETLNSGMSRNQTCELIANLLVESNTNLTNVGDRVSASIVPVAKPPDASHVAISENQHDMSMADQMDEIIVSPSLLKPDKTSANPPRRRRKVTRRKRTVPSLKPSGAAHACDYQTNKRALKTTGVRASDPDARTSISNDPSEAITESEAGRRRRQGKLPKRKRDSSRPNNEEAIGPPRSKKRLARLVRRDVAIDSLKTYEHSSATAMNEIEASQGGRVCVGNSGNESSRGDNCTIDSRYNPNVILFKDGAYWGPRACYRSVTARRALNSVAKNFVDFVIGGFHVFYVLNSDRPVLGMKVSPN